jgi:hypothetical protein
VTGGKADQIKTQIVDKSLHAEAPVSVAAAYECPATSFVRAGFEMDSEKTRIVKRGPAAALPVAAPSSGGAFPPIVAYQGKGIQIRFDFAKAPSNESMTAINATIVTNQPSVADFNMQVAVPKVRECMQRGFSQSWFPAYHRCSQARTPACSTSACRCRQRRARPCRPTSRR